MPWCIDLIMTQRRMAMTALAVVKLAAGVFFVAYWIEGAGNMALHMIQIVSKTITNAFRLNEARHDEADPYQHQAAQHAKTKGGRT